MTSGGVNQKTQLTAVVDVNTVQKEAWNQMIRDADQVESIVDRDTVNVDMSAVAQQLNEAAASGDHDDKMAKVISNEGVADSGEEDEDSDVGFDDDDDGLYDHQQPVFEGKSFLSYSP